MSVITLDAMAERIRNTPPAAGSTTVVAIDGPSGSGKTALATRLADRLTAPVVHMDELYPGWDGLAEGANALAEQVLTPLAADRPARYRHWDWHRGQYADWIEIPTVPVLLIEGCGSGSAPGSRTPALLIWVEAPPEIRRRRAFDRDGETYRPHWQRWARQEDALFTAASTRQRADLIVDTAVPHDVQTEVALRVS